MAEERMKKISLGCNGKFALVDEADYAVLNQYKWHALQSGGKAHFYAARRLYTKGKHHRPYILMHHSIIGKSEGFWVDHKNRNTLDNRRCNLRFVTATQNRWNSGPSKGKKYKGVYFRPNRERAWQAVISINGKRKHIGVYRTAKIAAIAYDKKVREMRGEFAWTNFSREMLDKDRDDMV